ncbi:MAG: NUDIX hydrolase [Chloroflexota bacterium]
MKPKVVESKILMEGRVFKLRHDDVKYPDGHKTTYDVIEHSGAVALVPIDDNGDIWFVRQYRHAAGESMLELPAGTLEQGEEPETCAHRELREEIGHSASKLEKLGEFYLAPGYSSEFMHAYMATQLTYNPLEPDEDEFLQIETLNWNQVDHMLINGGFRDAKTIACLLLAKQYNIGSK